MRTANFCPNCGEQLKIKRAGILSPRSYCSRCAPRFRLSRLVMIVNFAVCLMIGYAFGRYTTPRQPIYMLGTPIDPLANSNKRRDTSARNESVTPASPPSEETVKLCGARTKSGRPCRRKVVGGGYCWQHRDQYGPKKSPASVN